MLIDRICGLVLYYPALMNELKSLVKALGQFMLDEMDQGKVDSQIFVFYFQTYSSCVEVIFLIILSVSRRYYWKTYQRTSKLYSEESRNFLKVFHFLIDYEICNALVESLKDITGFAETCTKISEAMYPHLLHGLQSEFHIERFGTNTSLCDICLFLFKSDSMKLEVDQATKLYFMIYKLARFGEEQVLRRLIMVTTAVINKYGQYFKISSNMDGVLNTSVITSIYEYYVETVDMVDNPSLIELINMSFLKIPDFDKTPCLLKLLFCVTLKIQRVHLDLEEVEVFCFSSVPPYFNVPIY
ncbi:hypothetical protein RF11_14544 [Thelohanellus kitauei]|uniref:Uncharacterized protein n=1 Tax=Thelohanellus kitauei TaxID=669202 RepID=A0A0C2N9J6_THEKT|nr:hypothetical protein RF11_14544 [Thelohanellus kitauei]